MSNDNDGFKLSRRKALAGLGGIGVASAGAGVGTSAFFSDQESFEGNSITAGTLDIKVDWQQRYWGASQEARPEDYGSAERPYVNAFPDDSGDGVQDLGGVAYDSEHAVFNAAEVPACCDCGEGEYYVTYEGESYCVEPIVEEVTPEEYYDYAEDDVSSLFEDVQRDNGAVLFLYRQDHADGILGDPRLFFVMDRLDNGDGGGYATFTLEGDLTDAHWEHLDWEVEDDPGDDSDDSYNIDPNQAVANWIWGDERTDGGVLGSLTEDFAVRINPDLNGAAENSNLDPDWFDDPDVGLTSLLFLSGGTDSDDEVVLEDELGGPDANDDLTDIVIHSECGIDMADAVDSFGPNENSLIELDDVKPGDSGEVTFSLHVCDNPAYIWMGANDLDVDHPLAEFVQARARLVPGCVNDNDGFDDIADYDGDYLLEGELGDVLNNLTSGNDALQGVQLETEDGEDCFDPVADSTCVAFEWWFPTGEDDVNDAQGQSAEFDLGFYAEQCRHNDNQT